MLYDIVAVAAAVPPLSLADCGANLRQVLALAKEADGKGAAAVVFPELCLTGATCGDLFYQHTLINGALESLRQIIAFSRQLSAVLVVGLPLQTGGRLFNCAAVVQRGEILGVVPKVNLSAGELRHFSVLKENRIFIDLLGETVNFGRSLVFRSLEGDFAFNVAFGGDICSPAYAALPGGAALTLCPFCYPEEAGMGERLRALLSAHTLRTGSALVAAGSDTGESGTDYVYSGASFIFSNGELLAENPPFGQSRLTFAAIDLGQLQAVRRRETASMSPAAEDDTVYFGGKVPDSPLPPKTERHPFIPKAEADCDFILTMQAQALKRRMEHTKSRTAVIGISGGLDSTLALLVMHRAFTLMERDIKDITAVTMPCFGTTSRTKSNAQLLCEALGVKLREVDISSSVRQHFADIGQSADNHDVTFENAQARERTQVLMDIANMENGLVVGTGDLSELALGWATYNGDHMSMYAVNAGVPKTLVRHLVAWYAADTPNRALNSVLADILDTPVSPELLPAKEGQIAQKTEDLVGPYELHDFFLFNMMSYGFSPAKMLYIACAAFEGVYTREFILGWLKTFYRRFFQQQFKRSCMPDGPRVGPISLSPRGGLAMPSDALSAMWLGELEQL